ncbi:tyrosine-type recombinase/integrase [Schlesneria sp. DSM 10557]|uniref:tyrosine-type recombinase/integrase n=1 Tax=Schlesneria sp. DSM 10557 TaxID=3044399 RepID=UPI00359F6B8D
MAAIEKLSPLIAGRRWTYDTKVSGLALLTMPTGAKSFYLYKKVNGRPERHNLGKFPEVTVDAARDKANKLLARIADGDDPAEAKRKIRGELTLGDLWQRYLEDHAEAHKKARSISEDKGLWKRYLEPWKHRKLGSVQFSDCQSLHAKIGKTNGKIAANRMLSLLSKMYGVARDIGEFKNRANPTAGVKRFAEKSRDRFLQPDELPPFLASLETADNQLLASAFKLMLWTGARKSNVLAMTWDAVDLIAKTWRIPDTKQGEPQVVPLTPEAVEVLKKLRGESNEEQNFVFPARVAGSKTGHITDVTKSWRAITSAAGMPDLHIHDLRRTLGSWQALGGESLLTIGQSLGHKNTATTEVYARLMLERVRDAMTKATAAISAAGKPDTGKAENTDG